MKLWGSDFGRYILNNSIQANKDRCLLSLSNILKTLNEKTVSDATIDPLGNLVSFPMQQKAYTIVSQPIIALQIEFWCIWMSPKGCAYKDLVKHLPICE